MVSFAAFLQGLRQLPDLYIRKDQLGAAGTEVSIETDLPVRIGAIGKARDALLVDVERVLVAVRHNGQAIGRAEARGK